MWVASHAKCIKTCPKEVTQKEESSIEIERIFRTEAEPQQIVATRLLYRLQYPVPIQVVCKVIHPRMLCITIRGRGRETFPSPDPNPPDLVHGRSLFKLD
jgi:hypothetical protein